MNSDTGQIRTEKEILKAFNGLEKEAEQRKEMRKAGWLPFSEKDPVSLFDSEGRLIGHFKVQTILTRNRVMIKGICVDEYDELCKRKG